MKIRMFLSCIMSFLATKPSFEPVKLWRKINRKYTDQNLITTVKHGGDSVMVWGCMVAGEVGNLK